MITAWGEDLAYAMCGGCPVPNEVCMSYCHKWRGARGLEQGNLCLLREIERRRPGILKLTPPRSVPDQRVRDRHHIPHNTEMVTVRIQVKPVVKNLGLRKVLGVFLKSLGITVDGTAPDLTTAAYFQRFIDPEGEMLKRMEPPK